MAEATTHDGSQSADVPELNLLDPALREDPYPVYRQLREQAPVFRAPGGMWLLSSHQHCAAGLRDPRLGSPPPAPGGRGKSFGFTNPPEHTRLRSLVGKAFTRQTVERFGPRVQQVVDELLDAALAADEVDLVEAFADRVPATVICEMIGVPIEDWDLVKDYAPDLAKGTEVADEQRRGVDRLREYLQALVAERRRRPADDVLSALIAVEEEGAALDDQEIVLACSLLFFGGYEASANLIANGALALLRHPDQLVRFRTEPDLAGSAIEELLRYDSPAQLTFRVALAELEVGGEVIRQGEPVILLLAAANRDPVVFADPDSLDLGRQHNPHLAFGTGIHFCLGADLARLQGRIALSTLVRRAPDLQLTTDAPPYKDNPAFRGPKALPVAIES